jgi:3-methyladenine DNA glycosylase AlkC
MLAYAFIRERIVNNNSLQTFETDPVYGHFLDNLYIDKSIENENHLNDIKTSYPSILTSLVNLQLLTDSELFCNNAIGEQATTDSTTPTFDSVLNTSSTVRPY